MTTGKLEMLFFFFLMKQNEKVYSPKIWSPVWLSLSVLCIWVYAGPSAGQPCTVHVLFSFYLCIASHCQVKSLTSSNFTMNIYSYSYFYCYYFEIRSHSTILGNFKVTQLLRLASSSCLFLCFSLSTAGTTGISLHAWLWLFFKHIVKL